jgi:hypothetical protein
MSGAARCSVFWSEKRGAEAAAPDKLERSTGDLPSSARNTEKMHGRSDQRSSSGMATASAEARMLSRRSAGLGVANGRFVLSAMPVH